MAKEEGEVVVTTPGGDKSFEIKNYLGGKWMRGYHVFPDFPHFGLKMDSNNLVWIFPIILEIYIIK